LDEAKEELNAMERRARELQIFSDTFSRAEKDTIKILEFMEEIEEDIKKCKDAKEKVKLQQKNIEENNFKTMECIAQRKRVEKLLEQKREQFDRYKEEASIKLQAADHALKTAKEELEQLTASHSISQQQMEENEAKKNNLQRELHEEEQKYQQELAEIQEVRIYIYIICVPFYFY
jgi:hypothetical protein